MNASLPAIAKRSLLLLALAVSLAGAGAGIAQALPQSRQTTLLVPNVPSIEQKVYAPDRDAEKAAAAKKPAQAGNAAAAAEKAQAAKGEKTQAKAEKAAAKNEKASAKGEKAQAKTEKSPAKGEKPQAKAEKTQARGDKGQSKAEKAPAKGDKAQGKVDKAPAKGEKAAGKPEEKEAAGKAEEATAAAALAGQRPPVEEIVASVNASIFASASPEVIDEEVSLLIAGMDLAGRRAFPMDMPQIFTIYRFDREAQKPDQPVRREDRLGDIEEIRYLDRKAWGANVGLSRRGLYQFSIETRPWWNAEERGYEQQLVKTMLPVYGEDWGWHRPVGLSFEIVPLVRPFGLMTPALFSARVLVAGKPAAGVEVEAERIGGEDEKLPTPWHRYQSTRTLDDGHFSIVANAPGWWCCRAVRAGEPLKGPDGEPSPLRVSTIFWFYVDALPAAPAKK